MDPWLTAHACGQVCGKPLGNDCPHRCVLLCHPGQCPPCPQTLLCHCFCRRKSTTRRCDQQRFSCGFPCSNPRANCSHPCQNPCHDGPCDPCDREVEQSCHCGAEQRVQACARGAYSCKKTCDRVLPCGNHHCQLPCHPPGDCQECPTSTAQTCFCGRDAQPRASCLEEPISCGGTCNKHLPCGRHRCADRCHKGACACSEKVEKRCKCGAASKLLPCGSVWKCQSRCKRMRDCGKHRCKKRCCGGRCKPCDEQCEERLSCRTHRCQSRCHTGQCLPCPLTITFACPCGGTSITVPCGAERGVKPPKCQLACKRESYCHHEVTQHACHKSICPRCQLVCDKPYADCPHSCKLPCHDKLPPVAKYTQKEINKKLYVAPPPCTPLPLEQVVCPVCPEIVERWCYGHHELFSVVCSTAREFPCQRQCGHGLLCTNHTCEIACHVPSEESCRQCHRACSKPRPPRCKHACPRPCHGGDCPRCLLPVEHRCFCLNNSLSWIPCAIMREDPAEFQRLRSCGQTCRRRKTECLHLCGRICHKDKCAPSSACDQQTSVTCKCGRVSESWQCLDVQRLQAERKVEPLQIKLLECQPSCPKTKSILPVESGIAASSSSSASSEPRFIAVNEPRKRRARKTVHEVVVAPQAPSLFARLSAHARQFTDKYAKQLKLAASITMILALLLVFIGLQALINSKR